VKEVNLVFLGKMGAGKGTYAQLLQDKYGLIQISTGDLLREEASSGSILGQKIKKVMNEGKLVSDEIVTEVLKNKLLKEKAVKGFILDGYPRTLRQARLLEELLNDLGKKIDLVLNFTVSDETVVERISGRRQCIECKKIYHVKFMPPKKENVCDECGGKLVLRDDDREETVRKRLKQFHEQTEPLIAFYKQKGLLVEIDATPLPEKVFKELETVLKEKNLF
jgi:adenylate kinase